MISHDSVLKSQHYGPGHIFQLEALLIKIDAENKQ